MSPVRPPLPHAFKRQPANPEQIDEVLEALDRKEPHRTICARLRISSKTIQRIKRGF